MNNQYETALSIVKDYESYLEFVHEQQGYSLEQMSYSKWAVDEIFKYLDEQKTSAPLVVIENFRDRMDRYSRLNEKNGLIFSVACETAENIIDLFL